MLLYCYSLVGVIGAIGYVPQILNLIRSTGKSKAISLATWFIWAGTWVISLLYGIYELGDKIFIAIASINLLGHSLIISLTLWNRYFRFTHEEYVENLTQYIEEEDDLTLEEVAEAIEEKLEEPAS